MWEFSLNIKAGNVEMAKKTYKFLREYFNMMDGIVTQHDENGYIKILIAVKEDSAEVAKRALVCCITDIICNDFKHDYLDKYLSVPCQDKICMHAFKKALLNFDIETDKFIVKRAIEIKKDMYLDSFYHFKLKSLKDKWAELVALANENREYFMTDESFVDLLKFLVDNLDICEDEISIVKENEGYHIYKDNNRYSIGVVNEEDVVSSVIDLSPQKINLYVSENSSAINLLKQIFNERISINKISFQNVKKINLNR